MKLAAPLVIAAHLAALPALPGGWDGVAVFDGPVIRRDDLRRWATIGYLTGEGPVVHLEPVTDGQGQNRETGSIGCGLYVAAADIPAARAAVFDLLAAWGQWLATDRTLTAADGRPRLLTGTVSLAVDLALTTTRAGATASAVVTVAYLATTYG